MNILVTGGAGYIGSFMTKLLLDRGYTVFVTDSLERGHKAAIDSRSTFLMGNLLDKSFTEELFSKNTIDAVIHFAGYISMAESVKNPGIYFENNVFATINILEQMQKHNVKNIVFSSTAGVYGNPIKVPIPEDHQKNPTNPYGESKLMVEKILTWYNNAYQINSVCLRYFNAAGAALDASLGEDHNPETHIIPFAIHTALGKQKEFLLYGTDYNTADHTAVRDYIHVLDLTQAHILAIEKLQKVNGTYFYNVGTGKGLSNREVIAMVKKVSGIDFPVVEKERRPGDAEVLIADSTKIKNELGFSPQCSDIETIVKTAWEWHKKTT